MVVTVDDVDVRVVVVFGFLVVATVVVVVVVVTVLITNPSEGPDVVVAAVLSGPPCQQM
jgi:hypothetical protein